MNLSRVDLNLLVVFATIYDMGGITAAAQKLNLSQSAVSHALSRLRVLFNDPLFKRHGQGVVPTPLARQRVVHVRAALRSADDAFGTAQAFDPAASERRFTLAVRPSFETMLLPSLATAVLSASPTLRVHLVPIERGSLEDDLYAGQIDVAVDVLLPLQRDLRHAPLCQEPMRVVARVGHPALQAPLQLAQYVAAEHVQVTGRRSGPGVDDIVLSRLGVARRVRMRCQSFATACHTVAQTDLITTLPASYAQLIAQTLPLQVVPLPAELAAVNVELFMYWHANCDDDPANRWLREQLRAVLSPGVSPG